MFNSKTKLLCFLILWQKICFVYADDLISWKDMLAGLSVTWLVNALDKGVCVMYQHISHCKIGSC